MAPPQTPPLSSYGEFPKHPLTERRQEKSRTPELTGSCPHGQGGESNGFSSAHASEHGFLPSRVRPHRDGPARNGFFIKNKFPTQPNGLRSASAEEDRFSNAGRVSCYNGFSLWPIHGFLPQGRGSCPLTRPSQEGKLTVSPLSGRNKLPQRVPSQAKGFLNPN
jgi:hypothetical protein